MRELTLEEFKRARGNDIYYGGRWAYISKALEMAKSVNPQNVLELGPYSLPLFPGCDVMDNDATKLPDKAMCDKVYMHDASKIPWPIEDKAYDLFVGMQVWEHLTIDQDYVLRRKVFKEVQRIARAILLSFPYQWTHADPTNHHYNITDDLIRAWTTNDPPTQEAICEQSGYFKAHNSHLPVTVLKRKICLWT